MYRLLLFLGISSVVVACGDGTVGPLGGEGLKARLSVRQHVDNIRGYRSADNRPLDALIYLSPTFVGGGTDTSYTTYIEVLMADENGRIPSPTVSINGAPAIVKYSGYAEHSASFTDSTLTFDLTWPDTTIRVVHPMYQWETIGGDTFTYKRTWSVARGGGFDLPGLCGDSIETIFVDITDPNYEGLQDLYIQLDTGVVMFTPFISTYAVPDQVYLAVSYRSFYRVHEVPSPTSGYGPRLVGVLQRHRITTIIRIVN